MVMPRGVSIVGMLLLAMVLVQGPLGLALAADGEESGPPVPKVTSSTYTAEVWGPYAVTNVATVLENPSDQPVDHTFMFKVPEGALISNFSLTVGGRTFYADVLEKEFAQEQYNNAVSAGYTAGLVASKGDQVFTYGISLAPMETVKVGLRYEQVLLKANGRYSYELNLTADRTPLSIGTFSFGFHLRSTGVIGDLVTKGYEGQGKVELFGPSEAVASMVSTGFTPTEDITITWGSSPGPLEGTMMFGERDGKGYFVHIYEPDPDAVPGDRLPKDFVFVMDRSGSMGGTKIQQSKDALELIYGSLGAEDRFSLVTFNSKYIVYSSSLIYATDDAKGSVLAHIRSIDAGGSTDIHSAVLAALGIFKADKDPVPIIVLLSDGQANTGLYARSPFREDVLKQNTVDASIFCIAIGRDADWTFLEAMALENDGSAIWVGDREDAVAMISSFVGSFAQPLLADLTFAYGPSVSDVYPVKVRSHFIGTEVLVTGTFPLGTDEIEASIRSRGPEGPVAKDHTFKVPDELGADFVPRFWAFERIKALEDKMKWNGTDDASVREAIRLAIGFHFATDRTSLYVELPEELQNRFGEPAQQRIDADDGESVQLRTLSVGSSASGTTTYGAPTGSATPSSNGAYQSHTTQIVTDGSGGQVQTSGPSGGSSPSSPPPTAYASCTQSTPSNGAGTKSGMSDADGLPDVVRTAPITDNDDQSSWKIDVLPSKSTEGSAFTSWAPTTGAPAAYLPDYIVTVLIVGLTMAAVLTTRRRLRGRT